VFVLASDLVGELDAAASELQSTKLFDYSTFAVKRFRVEANGAEPRELEKLDSMEEKKWRQTAPELGRDLDTTAVEDLLYALDGRRDRPRSRSPGLPRCGLKSLRRGARRRALERGTPDSGSRWAGRARRRRLRSRGRQPKARRAPTFSPRRTRRGDYPAFRSRARRAPRLLGSILIITEPPRARAHFTSVLTPTFLILPDSSFAT